MTPASVSDHGRVCWAATARLASSGTPPTGCVSPGTSVVTVLRGAIRLLILKINVATTMVYFVITLRLVV